MKQLKEYKKEQLNEYRVSPFVYNLIFENGDLYACTDYEKVVLLFGDYDVDDLLPSFYSTNIYLKGGQK